MVKIMDKVKLMIPKKSEYLSTIRLTTSALLNVDGFDIEVIEDIKVIVSEICVFFINNIEKTDNSLEIEYFIEKGILIHYAISIELGCFLDADYTRKVLKEELFINEEKIFIRDDVLTFGDLKNIQNLLTDSFYQNKKSIIEISKNTLNDEECSQTNHSFS